MSAKQAIKQIVPRPIWAKLQSVKEAHNGRKAEKTQSQRFMRWISLDASTDKVRVETRLAFDMPGGLVLRNQTTRFVYHLVFGG